MTPLKLWFQVWSVVRCDWYYMYFVSKFFSKLGSLCVSPPIILQQHLFKTTLKPVKVNSMLFCSGIFCECGQTGYQSLAFEEYMYINKTEILLIKICKLLLTMNIWHFFMLFMYICFVMLYCIALSTRVLFAIKVIIINI